MNAFYIKMFRVEHVIYIKSLYKYLYIYLYGHALEGVYYFLIFSIRSSYILVILSSNSWLYC